MRRREGREQDERSKVAFLDVETGFIKRWTEGGRKEQRAVEREVQNWGGAALWLLLCRNVNTLQRWQKTMTPRGEEGASVSLPVHVCVGRACVRGRARQRHRGERKENDGGEMRKGEEPSPAKPEG